MTYTRIVSTGGYLPKTIRSNAELSTMMDTSDEWIVTRTGIKQRHLAGDNESCVDMCEQAARNALADAPFDAQALDMILVGTSTPDHIFPSNGTQLQTRLGCRQIPAMDIAAACSGFTYTLSVADAFIKSGSAKRILVVGADLLTNSVDWQDRNTAVLFGDGAGAAIVEASDYPGIHCTIMHSDGSYKVLLHAERGIGAPRQLRDSLSPYIVMQGRETFKVAVKSLSSLVIELLEKSGMTANDIDYLVPHQANLRIIKATAEHLNMPMEKVIVTVDQHANTSAASIPLALDHGIRSGKIKRGDKLLLEGFGGGFTWGGCILTY